MEHLHHLVQQGSLKKIRERLTELYHHGYVDRPRNQKYLWPQIELDDETGQTVKGTGGRLPFIYALGDEGAKHLKARSKKEKSSHWTGKNRVASERYLQHTMMINNFMVAMVRATSGTDVELHWHSEGNWPPDGHRVSVKVPRTRIDPKDKKRYPTGRSDSVPINPDGYFTLTWKNRLYHFFFEADTGSEPRQRKNMVGTSVYQKLAGYWYWWKKKECKQHKIPAYRVLTLCRTPQRVQSLLEIAVEVDEKRAGTNMFWFTDESEYSIDKPDRLFELIWRTPADPENYHSLLED